MNEGIESLKGRVQATSTELENQQKELERIKTSHSEQLKIQLNNFQKREDQQLKELNKKISEKDAEIEALQAQVNALNSRYPYVRVFCLFEMLTRIFREKKILQISKKF